jgi:hypothetical protein
MWAAIMAVIPMINSLLKIFPDIVKMFKGSPAKAVREARDKMRDEYNRSRDEMRRKARDRANKK